jgi:phage recombination protein Bet
MEKPKTKAVIEYRSQGGVDITLTPDAVRNFLVQGRKDMVTAQELMYFMNVCRARKLNPFIKDCYLIKYSSDPAAIVTSVDYFRKNARKAPDCKGWKCGIVIEKDGSIDYREGSLILDNENLVGGWAEAQPEGWNEPKKHTINLTGYIKKTKDGKITRFWQPERQPDMISKVAESQLLRQLWGEETTGMYSVEEMPSVEDVKAETVVSDVKERILGKTKSEKPETEKIPEPEELGFKKIAEIKSGEFEKKPVADMMPEKDSVLDKRVPLPEVKEPPKNLPKANDIWNPEKWKRLKSSGFSTYVWKHVASLQNESPEIKKAVEKKWKKIFKREAFPVAGENTVNGNANEIPAEVYHDPKQNGEPLPPDADFENPPESEPAPSKEDDPVGYCIWLRSEFPEQYEGALDYHSFSDAPATISADALKLLIQSVERLVDMDNQK